MSAKFKDRFCKKCKEIRSFRLRGSNKQKPYYTCVVCTANNDKRARINNWWKYLARKANSRKRDGSVHLTGQDIELLAKSQEFKCALTGELLDATSVWWKPSLDRIDSDKGYTLDNIRIVAWIVNHCRGDLTDEEFVDMCKKVAKYA